jgi:hypothetical protein
VDRYPKYEVGNLSFTESRSSLAEQPVFVYVQTVFTNAVTVNILYLWSIHQVYLDRVVWKWNLLFVERRKGFSTPRKRIYFISVFIGICAVSRKIQHGTYFIA